MGNGGELEMKNKMFFQSQTSLLKTFAALTILMTNHNLVLIFLSCPSAAATTDGFTQSVGRCYDLFVQKTTPLFTESTFYSELPWVNNPVKPHISINF